jgi:hypothetical protein
VAAVASPSVPDIEPGEQEQERGQDQQGSSDQQHILEDQSAALADGCRRVQVFELCQYDQ